MNEQELIFLVSVTVVLPILALWIILSYQKTQLKYRRKANERSLTTSELDDLIEDSVTAATRPLVDRIERLEKRLGTRDEGDDEKRLSIDLEKDVSEEFDAPSKTLGKTRA